MKQSGGDVNEKIEWFINNACVTTECLLTCPLLKTIDGDRALTVAQATDNNTQSLVCRGGPEPTRQVAACTMDTEMQQTIKVHLAESKKIASTLGWSACR